MTHMKDIDNRLGNWLSSYQGSFYPPFISPKIVVAKEIHIFPPKIVFSKGIYNFLPKNSFCYRNIFSPGLCLCILNYRPCLAARNQEMEEKGENPLFVSFEDPLGVFWESSWCLLSGTRLSCSPSRWRTSAATSPWCSSRTRSTWSHRARSTSECSLTFQSFQLKLSSIF